MKKITLAIIITSICLLGIYGLRMSSQSYEHITITNEEKINNQQERNNETQTNNEETTNNTQNDNEKTNNIPITQIEQHNNEQSCWVIYNNKVYDITSYLTKHPGGKNRILPYCGTNNFQEAFEGQHGTSKVKILMNVGTLIGDFDIIGNTQ